MLWHPQSAALCLQIAAHGVPPVVTHIGIPSHIITTLYSGPARRLHLPASSECISALQLAPQGVPAVVSDVMLR